MKKNLRWIFLCIGSMIYTMDTDDEYKKMHIQLIRQKYTMLSPIKWQDHEGYIYAYYASQEKRTRILITRKNGVYEKASIDKDQDVKTPPGEIDLQGYKGLLSAYESYVKNGSFEQLSLREYSN